MKIIDDIHERNGRVISFKSVCGGLPAPEVVRKRYNGNDENPLRYKFSWSPQGVITALQQSAKYRWDGQIVEVRLFFLRFFLFYLLLFSQ